jgi:hypothetical protein
MLSEHGASIDRVRSRLATAPYRPIPREERIQLEIGRILAIMADAPLPSPVGAPGAPAAPSALGRYTVKAYRLIRAAKREAVRSGSTAVETQHLLLALLHEEKEHFGLFLPWADSKETICHEIEGLAGIRGEAVSDKTISDAMNIPLSEECKRAEVFADEEATELGYSRVGPEHLLLGLLREEGSFAARVLREHGAELARIRRGLAIRPGEA